MRRNYIILPLMALTGLLAACQSIQPLSIDYMLPAEASFPATLRSVAVVNRQRKPKMAYSAMNFKCNILFM